MIEDEISNYQVEIFDLLGEICLFGTLSKPIINPKLSRVRPDVRSDKIFIKHGRLFIGNEEVPLCIQY
jgi:hypothetical protein